MRQRLCRTAALLAIAVGFALAARPAQADFISNYGYSYTTASFDLLDAFDRGVYFGGGEDWYHLSDSAYSGDAYAGTTGITSQVIGTEARAYSIVNGYASTGNGVYSSSESAYSYVGSYLVLNNTNSHDVLLPITTHHENYARAYSDASYNGYAYSKSQSFVFLYNAYGLSTIETWFAWAGSAGNFGLAGPLFGSDTFHYEVNLTPGVNLVGVGASVDGYGFVSVPAPVPEPGALTLAALGIVGIGGIAARKRSRS